MIERKVWREERIADAQLFCVCGRGIQPGERYLDWSWYDEDGTPQQAASHTGEGIGLECVGVVVEEIFGPAGNDEA